MNILAIVIIIIITFIVIYLIINPLLNKKLDEDYFIQLVAEKKQTESRIKFLINNNEQNNNKNLREQLNDLNKELKNIENKLSPFILINKEKNNA